MIMGTCEILLMNEEKILVSIEMGASQGKKYPLYPLYLYAMLFYIRLPEKENGGDEK